MDPNVRPKPTLVSLDLGTVGYYNRISLFNILNNAVNRGNIGGFRTSANGLTFREVSGISVKKPICVLVSLLILLCSCSIESKGCIVKC